MKCPFRKTIDYQASGTTSGYGYPMEWYAYEHFEDCVGKECAAFVQVHDLDEDKYIDYCDLCHSDIR